MADPNSIFDFYQRTDWDGATQTRRRRYRRMISLSHHITFFLAKRFPNAFPLIFVLGYPKSGTSWLCQLIADYLKLPFPQHSILPIGFASVVHGHEAVSTKYRKGVYIYRDGRDVMVSSCNHWLKNKGSARRSAFKADENQTIRDLLPGFIKHSVRHPFAGRNNWGQHLDTFFRLDEEKFPGIKYEDLLSSPEKTLEGLIKNLLQNNEPIDKRRIQATIERYSFTNQRRNSGKEENSMSYLRRGKQGDWMNHFTPESAQIFDKHYGTSLIDAGYETDRGWVEEFSDRVTDNNENFGVN